MNFQLCSILATFKMYVLVLSFWTFSILIPKVLKNVCLVPTLFDFGPYIIDQNMHLSSRAKMDFFKVHGPK